MYLLHLLVFPWFIFCCFFFLSSFFSDVCFDGSLIIKTDQIGQRTVFTNRYFFLFQSFKPHWILSLRFTHPRVTAEGSSIFLNLESRIILTNACFRYNSIYILCHVTSYHWLESFIFKKISSRQWSNQEGSFDR